MQNRKKIVLVDDDIDFIEAHRSLLERSGFDVVVASYTADACREKVCHEKPDLIILDVMMESLTTGFDLARELHNNIATKNIPILPVKAITGKLQFQWEPKRLDDTWLPAHAVLEKPVSPERLLAEVGKRICVSSSGEY